MVDDLLEKQSLFVFPVKSHCEDSVNNHVPRAELRAFILSNLCTFPLPSGVACPNLKEYANVKVLKLSAAAELQKTDPPH